MDAKKQGSILKYIAILCLKKNCIDVQNVILYSYTDISIQGILL